MRKGLSLNVRLTCLVGVMLAAIVGVISATLWVTNAQKADAVIINVAGRQRMLIQRITKDVLASTVDSCEHAHPAGRHKDRLPAIHDPQDHKKQAMEARRLFGETLTSLLEGGPATLEDQRPILPACADPRTRQQLKAVAERWKSFGASLDRIFAGDSLRTGDLPPAVDGILDESEKLLTEMNDVVGSFQAASENRVAMLAKIQYAAGAISLAMFMAVTFYVRYKVCRPIKNALAVADAVISGDLKQRCPISTTDEVGQLSHRLNQAIEAMARMMEDIKAAARAKSEFLANMSHEIRSPMTAILGYIDLVKEGCLNKCPFGRDESGDYIEIIAKNAHHLLQIINDILDLSKIEAGRLEVERAACSPAEVMAEVASLMQVRADEKDLSLELEYAGPMPEQIQSDPVRLRQILINLLGNAIKFTEVGSVRLVARLAPADKKPPRLQFDVIDTGIGMTEKQLARIFQPFVQADTSTSRQFGGSGLGLTISKRLAESLGGDVTVKSSPGKGSVFSLTVDTGPLDTVRMVDPSAEPIPPAKQTVKPSTVEKIKLDCRILLVEDSSDIQRLTSLLLQKAGAEVTVADNGKIALEKAFSSPFHLILMDMQMPVMDGYEATRRLRQEGYQGPIIALTAHAMKEDRQKCLDAGCDDYISKPIDRAKLLSTVARYAQAPKEQTPGERRLK